MYGYYDTYLTDSQPFTYTLITGAAETPVSLDELKAWLKITNTAQDALLTQIILAVTKSAELYTKRDFISKEYRSFRDGFFEGSGSISSYGTVFTLDNRNPLQLRRVPVNAITHVKYINSSGTQITVDSSDYYFTQTDGSTFSLLLPQPNTNWPDDLQTERLQTVELQFFAGWADAATFKLNWPDLYQAMLAHMADVFINRGDCSDISGNCGCASAPVQARRVYDLYKIIDFAVC